MRLYWRYRHSVAARKPSVAVTTAIARGWVSFIWVTAPIFPFGTRRVINLLGIADKLAPIFLMWYAVSRMSCVGGQ